MEQIYIRLDRLNILDLVGQMELGMITLNSKTQMQLTDILILILSNSCLCERVGVPPNRSRGRSGAPAPGLQGDLFYPSLMAIQDTRSLEWAKHEGDISIF